MAQVQQTDAQGDRYVNPEGLLDFAFLFDQEIEPTIEDYCMEVSDLVTAFKSTNSAAKISYHWHMNYENRTAVRLQVGSNQYLYILVFPDCDKHKNWRASVFKARKSIHPKSGGCVICKTPNDAATAIINEAKRVCSISTS